MPALPPQVQCDRHDGWVELVLNRPERRNAIDGLLAEALLAQLTALNADDTVQCHRAARCRRRPVFRARLEGLQCRATPPDWLPRFADTWHAVHLALLQCPQVLVVALERYAINGGAALGDCR